MTEQLMTEQPQLWDAPAPVSDTHATMAPCAPLAARRRPAHDLRGFAEGALLYAEGAPAERIHVVADGTVMLFKLLPDGRRHILDIVGPGTMIGMTSGAAYSASAKALTPVRLRALTRRQISSSPELSAELDRQMLARLDAMQSHALRLGRMSAVERIASLLWRLAGIMKGGDRGCDVTLGLSLAEIADHLGLVPETVCRNLATLKKAGVIAMPRPDRFRVIDADELSRLAMAPAPLRAAA